MPGCRNFRYTSGSSSPLLVKGAGRSWSTWLFSPPLSTAHARAGSGMFARLAGSLPGATSLPISRAIRLDHVDNARAGWCLKCWLGEITADVVLLDREHAREARGRAGRHALDEGRGPVQNRIPGFPEDVPEGLAWQRERPSGLTLRVRQAHVPALPESRARAGRGRPRRARSLCSPGARANSTHTRRCG